MPAIAGVTAFPAPANITITPHVGRCDKLYPRQSSQPEMAAQSDPSPRRRVSLPLIRSEVDEMRQRAPLKKPKADINMQTEAIKKRIIRGLASEINLIGSVELEHVGHALIELIEGKKLVHHGLNIEYRPVGYTVDSFTQDGKVVGEYSTLKTYFDDVSKKDDPPEYSKIPADIDHAVKHSDPRRIYLMCSQDEPESFREKYNNTAHGKQHLAGC